MPVTLTLPVGRYQDAGPVPCGRVTYARLDGHCQSHVVWWGNVFGRGVLPIGLSVWMEVGGPHWVQTWTGKGWTLATNVDPRCDLLDCKWVLCLSSKSNQTAALINKNCTKQWVMQFGVGQMELGWVLAGLMTRRPSLYSMLSQQPIEASTRPNLPFKCLTLAGWGELITNYGK